MEPNEEKLIIACKKKDSRAFKELYDRYAPKMMGICLRYMGSQCIAEDVLQEGFIKVYMHLNNYRFEGSFEGWIRKIIIHVALNYIRDHAKKEINTLDSNEIDIENLKTDTSIEDSENIPMDVMLHAIQNLSDMNRVVFNLSEIEGYAYDEIATQLNISANTVRSTLSRAKTILRSTLVKYKEFEGYEK